MGAYVEEKFKGGFLLDEGKLRKIVDLIEHRNGDESIVFKVFRGDSYSYETQSLDDVVNEDNDDWRAITKLQISLAEELPLDFHLTFSDEGLSIFITGENRDSVFLIYSDLREYFNNDVLKKPPMSEKTGGLFGMVLIFLAMALVFYFTVADIVNKDPSVVDAVLESNNLQEKINYLISDREERNGEFPYLWFLVIMFAPILLMTGTVQGTWNFIFPSNQFLFGDRKKKYEARMALISKIFWGVVVALIVSVIASVIVWRATT
ncbi:hypothetical protein MYE70_19805 [Marinobacter alexandrii]|uniref:hypothetical protein n=1 Tax=Marinobacter alexandrii TaxID=2570351 RepID=UPI001FFEF57F|nr:hypothetical protein [Marinobacter alexandrii]MCK2151318.1 hypothetical protein [Marinobacter alexandrii]